MRKNNLRHKPRPSKINRKFWQRNNYIAAALIFIGIGIVGIKLLTQSHADAVFPEFRMECDIDHFGPDDPIVYPGTPGASHMHSFFGNKTTDAYTTPASLTANEGSCNYTGAFDRSAYWVPSLYNGSGTRFSATTQQLVVYYRKAGGPSGPMVHPFPVGLRIIAGDAKATSPQPQTVSFWDCGDGGPVFPNVPDCTNSTSGVQPVGVVLFPNCWDGVHLDSADHKSHMAYSNPNTGVCPADHPVSLPQLRYEMWENGTPGGSNFYLSSGGQYSMHGDFFAEWDSRLQSGLIDKCMNSQTLECSTMQVWGDNSQGHTKDDVTCCGGTKIFNLNDYSVVPVAGDINSSGKVDLVDLSILLSKWGTNYSAADLDKSGSVGLADLSILLSHYGT